MAKIDDNVCVVCVLVSKMILLIGLDVRNVWNGTIVLEDESLWEKSMNKILKNDIIVASVKINYSMHFFFTHLRNTKKCIHVITHL